MQYVGLFLFKKDREKLEAAFRKSAEKTDQGAGKAAEADETGVSAEVPKEQRPVPTIAGYFASLVRKK